MTKFSCEFVTFRRLTEMYWFIPLLFVMTAAKPLYVGTPSILGQSYSGLHPLTQSGLVSQPLDLLFKFGNLEQIGGISKSLLASHLGGQKLEGFLPTSLAFASSPIHPLGYPISMALKEIVPEKTVAGALIKQVPKLSKHPIAVSFSPKSLKLNEEIGGLGGAGLLTAPVLSGKSFLNELGLSFEY